MPKTNSDTVDFPFYWVDAFTDEPFSGNPAGVCAVDIELKPKIMQSIAAEIGLSETAFIQSLDRKDLTATERVSLRWFTPKAEVKLCGHATLASAAALFYEIRVQAHEVTFETLSGQLKAKKLTDGIDLDFPAETFHPATPKPELLKALGLDKVEDSQYSERLGMLLLRISSDEKLRALQPNFEHMKTHDQGRIGMGVIVTAHGKPPFDFVSRFFAPQLGIDEDPVTGSSHTVLTPYWSKIIGKTELTAYQASHRGGKLKVRLTSNGRVSIIGKAYILIKGRLHLPRQLVE